MRKRYKIICSLIILILLVGCQNTVQNGKEGEDIKMDKESDVEIPEEDIDTKNKVNRKISSAKPLRDNNSQVSMKTKINKKHMLEVEIKNISQEKICFGRKYQLYRDNEYEWEVIDYLPNVGFKDIEYNLEESETFSEEIDLEKLFGVIGEGKYRIEKEITLKESRIMVSSEFQINSFATSSEGK